MTKLFLLAQLCSGACIQQQYLDQDAQVWQQLHEQNQQQRMLNSIDGIRNQLQLQQQQLDSMPRDKGYDYRFWWQQ